LTAQQKYGRHITAIVVTVRISLMMFFPQQLQSNVLPALQLLMDNGEVRQRTAPRRRRRRRWEDPVLQGGIIEVGGQWP
jgi:hypothetical protein